VESAALAVFGYCMMFGLWGTNPGASVPGRYMCSAIPLMAILVALWCERNGTLWNPRAALAAGLLFISAAFVVVSILVPIQPYYLFRPYTNIFQEYWNSNWELPDTGNSVRPLALVLLTVLAATKIAGMLWKRSAGDKPDPAAIVR